MYQQDYIKRQIERLMAVVAAMMGRRREQQPEEALKMAEEGYTALEIDPYFLQLDDASLVLLLRSNEKVTALADLLEEEACCRLALGQSAASIALMERAARLRNL